MSSYYSWLSFYFGFELLTYFFSSIITSSSNYFDYFLILISSYFFFCIHSSYFFIYSAVIYIFAWLKEGGSSSYSSNSDILDKISDLSFMEKIYDFSTYFISPRLSSRTFSVFFSNFLSRDWALPFLRRFIALV